jgi:DNA-binding transcriptional regulator GbsR (MarR family)
MDPLEREFIERVGLSVQVDGLPRIAGRLFGLLLLSPGPQSLDEIAETLGVSKGSASTDARLLVRHGWLKRTSQAGDRRDYYELSPDFFAGVVAYRLGRWDALYESVAEGRKMLPRQPDVVRDRLKYLDDVQQFFLKGIHQLLDDWQTQQQQGAKKKGVTH